MTDRANSADGAVEAGRDAFRRRAWRDACALLLEGDRQVGLELEDLERLAVSAHLIASEDCADLWIRTHRECLRLGLVARAARCAFWLSYEFLNTGEIARAGGWLARAEQLIDEYDLDCAERGYLLVPQAIGRFDEDPAAALEHFVAACAIGERFRDADLTALARMGRGQALVALGKWKAAVTHLDQAMVAVTAGETSPIITGLVFCGAIDACQGLLDLRRAAEWSVALTRWCDTQPDLVPFRGQCLVHRAEIMQVHGEWADALAEARRAVELLSGAPPTGEALYRQGELHRLRGELSQAESAYREAMRAGRDPQPGLALLWLAMGRHGAAAAAVQRALAEARNQAVRARILAPYVEITLAAGDIDAARSAAQDLDVLAAELDTPLLRGMAAAATGAVLLAQDDSLAALPRLREAWATWHDLAAPYEAARVRVLIGLACRAAGDTSTADMELDAARLGFEALNAERDVARVDALLNSRPGSPGVLTSRETEVLRLVAKGSTNREIATALVISEHTVARHVQHICAKLGVSSRTAASSFAYEHNML